MRSNYQTISIGLDQLFFNPFIKNETPEDRAEAIDNFLKLNGWTWDQVINHILQEPL